jgi:hypothetical protein
VSSIAADDGPCHHRPDKLDVTAANKAAVDRSSAANPSQAATAANIEPGPTPVCIRSELTSGGNTTKSIVASLPAGLQ